MRLSYDDGEGELEGVDESAADAQLLELLQKPFYFTQHCDMVVSDLHFPEDEQAFAVNLKQQVVQAFAHKVVDAAEYEHLASDQFGDKSVRVTRVGDSFVSVSDGARPVPMRVKRQSDGPGLNGEHFVDMDSREHAQAALDAGVMRSYRMEQTHQFPGRHTRDDLADDAARAENIKHADDVDGMDAREFTRMDERDLHKERFAAAASGIEIHAFAATTAALKQTRARRLRAADPQLVESFAAFSSVAHGAETPFVTRRFGAGLVHQLHAHSIRGDDADAEFAKHLYSLADDGAELSELLALLSDKERGHVAWRALLHRVRVGEANGDSALFDALRASVLSALPHTTSSAADGDSDDVPAMPHDALQHVLSLLAEVGGAKAEAVLVETALRAPDDSLSRNQALLALAGVRGLADATLASLSELVRTCSCAESLCVQLSLTLGAAGNELHHVGRTQAAHDVRELLFVRMAAERDERACATVFALALNNTMYQVDTEDERLYEVELGRWLDTSDGGAASELLYDGSLLQREYSFENELEAAAAAAPHGNSSDGDDDARKRSEAAPTPMLSLSGLLGGKSGTSGWKKWYEGWSVSSRKNEYLPEGGIDQSGQNWGVPSDTPGEPQYGLNGLNTQGKARDRGLLTRCQGSYRDGTPCASKHYDNYAPRNPDKGWQKKLGSGQFYAMIEAALHKRVDGEATRNRFYFALDFFAGAQFSASLMGKKVPILSAYARANVSITDERDKCSFFDVGLFYFYFGKMFFWGIGTGDCQFVDSTCKPWFPEDRSQMGYLEFAHEVFFQLTFSFALGPIPMVVFVEGVGGAGMYYSVDMIFAPALKDKDGNECGGIDDGGGSMLNGYCEPEAYVSLAAELGIGVPVLSAGIGIQVTLIRVSLPASAGLNFVTQRPCLGIGVSVGALGGKIYLWARIGLCKGWIKICIKLQKTIYDWKGLAWEQPLLRVDCCKPCPGACNNAWCDYKFGVCRCNDEWGGKLCNMNCPKDCKDIDTINPGVSCMVNPDPNARSGEICECKLGYFGWNCLIPCPGLRDGDPEPKLICSGHGVCSEFGYQASSGFGINRDVEDTLVAHCACEDNFFGERCDITCPPDPETGRVCGSGGGVCVYDGQRAFCQCLKGYAGPECKARCPLFRGSPCGYRGDCIWEDGRATCHCHLGFSGAGCEQIDTGGGGRALYFDQAKQYYATVPDGLKLRSVADVYTVGFWFKPAAASVGVDATLLTWRWGRVLLLAAPGSAAAELAFCDARSPRDRTGCVVSPVKVTPGADAPWQYVYASVASYTLAHDKQLWHGVPAGSPAAAGGVCQVQGTPYSGWCLSSTYQHENSEFNPVKGEFRFGLNFTGAIDNLYVYGDRPTTAEVNERAHNVPEPDDLDLLYAALFDEGRGDTFYDERQLMVGQLEFSGVGGVTRFNVAPEDIWANPSGVRVQNGAIYSNVTDAFTVGNGSAPLVLFQVNLRGARLEGANLHFQWAVAAPALCPLTLELVDDVQGTVSIPFVDETARPKMLNGRGRERVPLAANVLSRLRAISAVRFTSGRDAVANGQCEVTVDKAFIEAVSPLVDPMVEFTGRPSAFAFTNAHKPLRLPFTIEMWIIRPALLRSNRGLLLALVDGGANSTAASIDGPFLLHETGFPRLGLQYRYQGQTQKVVAGGHDAFERYTVPGGEWVHLAVTVEASTTPNKCLHRFMVNGETGRVRGVGDRTGFGEVLDYPGPMAQINLGDKPNYCAPAAALEGWGDARFNLRLGAKFLGALNDVRVHSRALTQTEIRAQMLTRQMSAASLLHEWTFAGVMRGGAKNEPVLLPDMAGGASLTMNDGAHLGLVVAIMHEWEFCPGISFQFPESICSAEPTHAHGTCKKPRGVREDERNEDDEDGPQQREKGFVCECTDGYRPGPNGDCSLECPGGYANPCSGHGRCVDAVAPIEPWEQADGTENKTYVGDDPNVHDRRQGTEVTCVCDEGYVGPSCNFECPGWSADWNRPQRLCSGYGSCNYTVSGGATCQCFDSSQRYGDACEFIYGNKPDAVISECGLCNGANEQCRDTTCACVDGYFRVFGVCRAHIDETEAADNTAASYAAAFVVIALFCCIMAGLGALYFLRLK